MMSRWGARQAPDNSAAEADVEDLEARLRSTRRKLKQIRRERRTLRAYYDRAQQKLEVLRAHTLDLFPEVEVPRDVAEVMSAVRAEKLTYLAISARW
jgi:predicted nuclease with TOPRIM domain